MKKNQIILAASVFGAVIIGYIVWQQIKKKKNKDKGKTDDKGTDGLPLSEDNNEEGGRTIFGGLGEVRGTTNTTTNTNVNTGTVSSGGFQTFTVISNTPLNVRRQPNAKAAILSSLPKGTQVLAKPSGTAGWSAYSKDGITIIGYISSQFISTGGGGALPTGNTGVTGGLSSGGYQTFTVISSTPLNVRRQPNAKAAILSSLPKGTKVLAKPSGTAGWSAYSKDGKTIIGYISSKYIK